MRLIDDAAILRRAKLLWDMDGMAWDQRLVAAMRGVAVISKGRSTIPADANTWRDRAYS